MERASLIYDGQCGHCRSSVEWIRKRDRHRAFEFLAYQEPSFPSRFPRLSRSACERALHLVTESGTVYAGADALPHILSRIPGWGWAAALLSIPVLQPLYRRLYRRLARHRSRDDDRAPCEFPP